MPRITLLATVFLCHAALGQTQNYKMQFDRFDYLELTGMTTIWNGAQAAVDDAAQEIPLGFDFEYFGQTHSSVWVSSNGYLFFPPATGLVWLNDHMPSPGGDNGIIAPWWDDLEVEDFGATDSVSYKITGNPGFRQIFIEWKNMSHVGDSPGNANDVTFNVRLREGSSNIRFHYGAATTTGSPASMTASIGLENHTGTHAVCPYAQGNPSLGMSEFPPFGTVIHFNATERDEYSMTMVDGSYVPLSAGRTVLFDGSMPVDDASFDVAVGFPFELYGQPLSTLRVSTNGYATTITEAGDLDTNWGIPQQSDPNPLLAPWWDDLQVADLGGATDQVSHETIGMPGARRFIVQWSSISRASDLVGNYSYLNFQLHLVEGSNEVEFHYGTDGSIGTPPQDFSASVGIESDLATHRGIGVFQDTPNLTRSQFPETGTIIVFTPAAPLCGDCNNDGQVSILDSLLGAQHGLGLATVSGNAYAACNVTGTLGGAGTPGAVIDILDALTVAQFSSGVLQNVPCMP